MNKTQKTILIIAAIVVLIFILKPKKSEDGEKSGFLGIFKPKAGSQKWADALAKRYCALQRSLAWTRGFAAQNEIQKRMAEIIAALSTFGYVIDGCKAVKNGDARKYITQAEADCRNANGSWVYDAATQQYGCKGAGIR